MAVTPLDLVVTQRNSAGTKFTETIVPDNSEGFLGFNGSNIPVIRKVVNADITNSEITLSKVQNITANKFLGRVSIGSGDIEELTPDDAFDVLNVATNTLSLNRLANIGNNTLLGNTSGSSAPASAQDADDIVNIINTATTLINFDQLTNVGQYTVLGSITVGTNPVVELDSDDLIELLNQGTTPLNGTVAPGSALSNISNNTVLGNTSGISAPPTELSPNSVIGLLQGASNALTSTQIPTINYSKIQNVSAENLILGRITTGAGDIEELTPDNIISILNNGTTSLNNTIVPRVNAGSFTALFREAALGTVTTTQNIDVTDTQTPLRLVVTATLSTENVIFNFTNLASGLKGMEIILIITNGGTSRNVTIYETGADANMTSGITGYTKPSNIPSGSTGNTIFGMIWDGTKLHVNNLKYSSGIELNAGTEDKSKIYENWADFQNGVVGTVYTSTTAGTGAISAHVANTSTSVPQLGIHRMSTGSTATGRGSMLTGSGSIMLGQGSVIFEAKNVSLSALQSVGVQEYFFNIGFIDTVTAEPTDGVYFEYNTTNPTTWTICTANNSTRTKTNSGATITAAAFYNLRIEINAAASSVSYFINGANVGTITTNIPNTLARVTGIGATIRKTVGTTAITADVDAVYFKYVLNTTR